MIDLRTLYYRNRPEELLKREVRELEDQVPRINEGLAQLKAQVTLHAEDLTRLIEQGVALEEKMRAAEEDGRPDLAFCYAETIERLRAEQHRTEEDLALAREAFDGARRLKAAFMDRKERAIDRAREALRARRRIEWNRRASRALKVFEARLDDPLLAEVAGRLLAEAEESDAELKALLRRLTGAVS